MGRDEKGKRKTPSLSIPLPDNGKTAEIHAFAVFFRNQPQALKLRLRALSALVSIHTRF